MASISDDPNGRKRILFIDAHGKRRPLRLGKVTARQAEAVKLRVERLAAAQFTGHPPDDETSRWLADLDTALYEKLAAVSLVRPRTSKELGPWLEKYIGGRSDLKPESRRKLQQTIHKLLAHFPAGTLLRAISPDQAADWRQALTAQGLSVAAVKTHSGNVKTIFSDAVKRGLVSVNPFADLKSGPTASDPDYYVTPTQSERIIAELPGAEWRLLFGLARYAGLRIPSESSLLTWADVDWQRGRLNVRAPKTERHAGHERRMVPITPRLMELLRDRFEAAKPGSQRLVTMRGAGHVRRHVEGAIARAGVPAWAKLFQALRSSCEKEWAMTYPQYAVSKWIGHGLTVSGRHYVNDVPEELFDKAVVCGTQAAQNPAQQAVAPPRNAPQTPVSGNGDENTTSRKTPQGLASNRKPLQVNNLEAGGIEPPSRDNSNGGLYMLSRCFDLGFGSGRRQSLPKPSRLSLASPPTAERRDQPAVLQPT